MIRKLRKSIAVVVLMMLPVVALAHGGRTNSEGCHRESKTNTNTTHCHNGSGASKSSHKAANHRGSQGYDRSEFMTGWLDEDGDCQDARQEVLVQESLIEVTLTKNGCRVVSGLWYDPFTGKKFVDPGDLDIDHFVPLKEAYDSGADQWSRSRKSAYANDLASANTLIAVSLSANRSKGAKDPAQWMPPNKEYHCEYLVVWASVKEEFELTMDKAEFLFISNKLNECRDHEKNKN